MTCTCTIATDPGAMTDAIRARYQAARGTDAATDGVKWYTDAERMIGADAERTGLPHSTVAAVYAACSINASWAANRTIANRWLDYATGARAERPGCMATVATRCESALAERPETFDDAFRIVLAGGDARGSKVASFVANFHGREDFVTVDRWAMVGAGVASMVPNTNPTKGHIPMPCPTHGKAPKGLKYDRIAAAYREVAAEFGVAPRDLQAIVWVAVRGAAN